MKTKQIHIKKKSADLSSLQALKDFKPDLTLVFGDIEFFSSEWVRGIQSAIGGQIVGCSTAGEITGEGVSDKTLVVTGIKFESARFKIHISQFDDVTQSQNCGAAIGKNLNEKDLKAVFVLGKGLGINGTGLIAGLKTNMDPQVVITGGLAGDNGNFKKTYVMHNDRIETESVVAVGFYGEAIEFGFGSRGGWDPFGPTRKVTKASGTKMYELDGERALNVYKTYLKDFAKDLPASGLLFPFAILDHNQAETGLIRTILGVDEAEGSLTLAGDVKEGQLVRLMHTQSDGLVDGARTAAELAHQGQNSDGLAILISCVGRKLVMGDLIDDEIEAVQEIMKSENTTGFYSYGEICPFKFVDDCQLHNQTMTITYLTEKKKAA